MIVAAHGRLIKRVDWNPAGRRLLSVGEEQLARVWDVETLQQVHEIEGALDARWGPFGIRMAVLTAEGVEIHDASVGAARGRWKQLLPLLERQQELGRTTADDLRTMVELYTSDKQWKPALNAIDALQKQDPDDPRNQLCIAVKEIANYSQEITPETREPELYIKRAQAYEQLGRWAEAGADYEEAIKLHTGDISRIQAWAVLQSRSDGLDQALPRLEAVSAANPKDTSLTMTVAALQAWFGQDNEYAATADRALRFARGTTSPVIAERIAKACCLRPTQNERRLTDVLELARSGVENGRNSTILSSFQMALGMAEYRIGNFVAAEASLRTAEKGNENTNLGTTAALYRAMSLFRQGKQAEARKLFAPKSVRMKPLPKDENNPFDNGAYADDLITWLAYKEAKALIEFPNLPVEAYASAAAAEHFDTAAAFAWQLLESNPENAMYWIRFAPIMQLADRPEEYERFCDFALRQPCDTLDQADKLIKACLLQPGVVDPSELPTKLIRDALAESSLDNGLKPWYWGTLALVAYRAGDFDHAKNCLDNAEEIAPNSFQRITNLSVQALLATDLKYTEEAVSALHEGSQLIAGMNQQPNQKSHHDTLIAGILFREAISKITAKVDPHNETSKSFREALEQNGLLGSLIVSLACALANLGDEQAFKKFCVEHRDLIDGAANVGSLSLNNLAWQLTNAELVSLRDPHWAVSLAEKVIRLEPGDANTLNTLGVAYYRAGKWQQAFDTLGPLLEDPEHQHSYNYFFIAMSHWQLDHKEAARIALDKAIEWMNVNAPKDAELIRFRDEARQLVGDTGKQVEPN